jgi:hypothetical protein
VALVDITTNLIVATITVGNGPAGVAMANVAVIPTSAPGPILADTGPPGKALVAIALAMIVIGRALFVIGRQPIRA